MANEITNRAPTPRKARAGIETINPVFVRAFFLTVKLGSMSAAARALGESPAGVSKQISLLESALGFERLNGLIIRSTRRHIVTEAGLRFYRHADVILQAFENALEDLGQIKVLPVIPHSDRAEHGADEIPEVGRWVLAAFAGREDCHMTEVMGLACCVREAGKWQWLRAVNEEIGEARLEPMRPKRWWHFDFDNAECAKMDKAA